MSTALKYGFTKDKRLSKSKTKSLLENSNVRIELGMTYSGHSGVTNNRPDMVIFDKLDGKIFIVDVAVTSAPNLTEKENHKITKYQPLAQALGLAHSMSTQVIPYVISWDGLVTSRNSQMRAILGVSDRTLAYSQQIALRHSRDMVIRDILNLRMDEDITLEESQTFPVLRNALGDDEQDEVPVNEERPEFLQTAPPMIAA
jgi:hypothetical protein